MDRPPPPRLAEVLAGRDNNLNAIRMLAAAAVMVSHAWPITLGAGAVEPLYPQTGQTLGHFAVAVFFGVSGLLIARSFDRRRSMIQFLVARVLRLFPALLVVLVLTVIAGAFVTQLGLAQYLGSRDTWTYVPANMSLAFMQYALPGVFTDNAYGPPINGSLWTLFYEVACYGGVVVLGLLGILRHRLAMLAVMVMATLLHFAGPLIAQSGEGLPAGFVARLELLALLSFPFALGTFAYVWREQIRLSGWIALLFWLPVPLLAGTGLMATFITLALVYTTFWIGFVPKGRMLVYNRLGDYSYGVYIYAFPVQQLLVWQFPGMAPVTNILLAAPVTLGMAILSWKLVEARAIAAGTPIADRLAVLLRLSPSAADQSL
jgi:peptidoglycan/LPS O-acetylase OafA/YrhL